MKKAARARVTHMRRVRPATGLARSREASAGRAVRVQSRSPAVSERVSQRERALPRSTVGGSGLEGAGGAGWSGALLPHHAAGATPAAAAAASLGGAVFAHATEACATEACVRGLQGARRKTLRRSLFPTLRGFARAFSTREQGASVLAYSSGAFCHEVNVETHFK